MQAIRIHPSPTSEAYSPSNPAPSSALVLDHVPIPEPGNGQLLLHVHAATVTRDEMTWPESYVHEYHTPGYDLAGVVVGGTDSSGKFKVGDQVYAFLDGARGAAWAERAVVEVSELALKPRNLSMGEAATGVMSGLTAWQALFVKAGVPEPDFDALSSGKPASLGRSVLVTGASGAVGSFIVQLAALAGLHVVAASSSTARNEEFLRSLGASEIVEYKDLAATSFDLVIDTVGGDTLMQAWNQLAEGGNLVTVDSGSYDIANKVSGDKKQAKALFFILEPSGVQLSKLARGFELGLLKTSVAHTFPLHEAQQAYEKASGRLDRRGKVVLSIL